MCVYLQCMYGCCVCTCLYICVNGYTCVTILFTDEYASESYVTTETNNVTG